MKMITSWLLHSPVELVMVVASYLAIITLGPYLMKNRPPFDLRKILIGFNCSQIFFNTFAIITMLPIAYKLTIFCNPETDSSAYEIAVMSSLYREYLLLKLYDLLDTVLFVLRKKQAQISFLHVYHHILILVGTWIIIKYFPPGEYPGGGVLLFGTVNCSVHAVMYLYYLKSAIEGTDGKNIWWKKYVTLMQLVQHYVMFFLCIIALVTEECPYPKRLVLAPFGGFFTMVYLFTRFYYNTYVRQNEKVANGDVIQSKHRD